MEKIPQKQMYTKIAELCADHEDIVDFCEYKIKMVDKKTEQARARAAAKKVVGDELYALVISCVKEEPVTIEQVLDEVVEYLGDETMTKAKIRARLSQGVQNEVLVRTVFKAPNGKNKVHYTQA